jgi:hypothetical protein
MPEGSGCPRFLAVISQVSSREQAVNRICQHDRGKILLFPERIKYLIYLSRM